MHQLPLFSEYTEMPFLHAFAHHDGKLLFPVIDQLMKKQEKLERDIKLLKYLFVRRS